MGKLTQKLYRLGMCALLLSFGVFSNTNAIGPQSLDSLITRLNENLSADSAYKYIDHLQSFGTRYRQNENRKDIAEWIASKFSSFGIVDVELDSLYEYDKWQYNVVATIPTDEDTDEVIVVGAHYDSRSYSALAPGADDNASGVAGILEISRTIIHNSYLPKATIKFVAFAHEEFGLVGSKDFVQKALQDSMNIQLMINLDMIGYTPVGLDSSSVGVLGKDESEDSKRLASQFGNNYSDINVIYKSTSAASDHNSFSDAGYKAIMYYESVKNPHYHSESDSLHYLSMPYLVEVTKSAIATLIGTMYLPEMVKDLSIVDWNNDSNGNSVKITWNVVDNENVVGYKVYSGHDTLAYDRTFNTIDTTLIIEQLVSGEEYFFGVNCITNEGLESAIREETFTPFTFTLDQGILLVDETYEWYDYNALLDDEVDNFYRQMLEGFTYLEYDIEESKGINISDLGIYSTIIWHGDDDISSQYSEWAGQDIKRYLDAGGNLFYTGYRPSRVFVYDTKGAPTSRIEGESQYEYFGYDSLNIVRSALFSGAISTTSNYNDLIIDTSKTTEKYNYHLRYIESMFPKSGATSMFAYDTKYDSTSIEGSMKGEPIGVEYLTDNFKVVSLSIPLYYTHLEGAKQLMRTVINKKFGEPVSVVRYTAPPTKFELNQNYPNPFNPTTKINYSIPKQSIVSIKVYDVLGREVTTLVNKEQQAGIYEVEFDASDLGSGIYFYELRAGNFVESKKMILLK